MSHGHQVAHALAFLCLSTTCLGLQAAEATRARWLSLLCAFFLRLLLRIITQSFASTPALEGVSAGLGLFASALWGYLAFPTALFLPTVHVSANWTRLLARHSVVYEPSWLRSLAPPQPGRGEVSNGRVDWSAVYGGVEELLGVMGDFWCCLVICDGESVAALGSIAGVLASVYQVRGAWDFVTLVHASAVILGGDERDRDARAA